MRVYKKYLLSLIIFKMVAVKSTPVLDEESRIRTTNRQLHGSSTESLKIETIVPSSEETFEQMSKKIHTESHRRPKNFKKAAKQTPRKRSESLSEEDRGEIDSSSGTEGTESEALSGSESVKLACNEKASAPSLRQTPTKVSIIIDSPAKSVIMPRATTTQLILGILVPQVAKKNGNMFYIYEQIIAELKALQTPGRTSSSLPFRLFTGYADENAGFSINMAMSFIEKPKKRDKYNMPFDPSLMENIYESTLKMCQAGETETAN